MVPQKSLIIQDTGTHQATVGSHTSTPWAHSLPWVSVPTIVLIPLFYTDPSVELIPSVWISHPKNIAQYCRFNVRGTDNQYADTNLNAPSSFSTSLFPGSPTLWLSSFTDIISLPYLTTLSAPLLTSSLCSQFTPPSASHSLIQAFPLLTKNWIALLKWMALFSTNLYKCYKKEKV